MTKVRHQSDMRGTAFDMPPIFEYKCNHCGFSLPSGWGGYMYVTDDAGRRHVCPHPCEDLTIKEVLGESCTPELRRARTGFNSHRLCCDCLFQMDADTKRDALKCLSCESTNVKTIHDLIDHLCPNCKVGMIEAIDTGSFS